MQERHSQKQPKRTRWRLALFLSAFSMLAACQAAVLESLLSGLEAKPPEPPPCQASYTPDALSPADAAAAPSVLLERSSQHRVEKHVGKYTAPCPKRAAAMQRVQTRRVIRLATLPAPPAEPEPQKDA